MSTTNGTRRCEACSEPLSGRQRRFCSDRCRMRVARLGERNPNANGGLAAPQVAPGRALAGLEAWASQFGAGDLPQVLLEAARALAAEVDKAPTASNLWGRYAEVVRQLTDHVEALRNEVRDELAPILGELQHLGDVDRYRAERFRRAVADGDPDADRWGRLVPVGCVEGRHRVRRWPGGRTTCADCQVDLDPAVAG